MAVIILVFTKANANPVQAKPTTQLLRRTVTEEVQAQSPCSQASLDSRAQGSGGCHRKGTGGGGFSGPKTKPDTDGQSYLIIEYTSQGFQINFQIGCDEEAAKEHIHGGTILT
jgi:hypothetical protein